MRTSFNEREKLQLAEYDKKLAQLRNNLEDETKLSEERLVALTALELQYKEKCQAVEQLEASQFNLEEKLMTNEELLADLNEQLNTKNLELTFTKEALEALEKKLPLVEKELEMMTSKYQFLQDEHQTLTEKSGELENDLAIKTNMYEYTKK